MSDLLKTTRLSRRQALAGFGAGTAAGLIASPSIILAQTPDAIRFGASDMASFSPSGSCTAGSLFLRSAGNVQYAVRVAGVTGRTRILRYNAVSQSWDEM